MIDALPGAATATAAAAAQQFSVNGGRDIS